MSGTSYLAVSQWFTAAEQPPHLAAINPWEGVSDVYRDLVMRGGMPDTGFAEQLQDDSFRGKNRSEDIVAEAGRYPLINEAVGEQDPAVRARSPCRPMWWPATPTPCTPREPSAAGGGSHPRRSGSASTTAWSGPTTTTRRIPMNCADSSTTTSKARTTGGSRPRRSATQCSIWKAATAQACRLASSRRKASPTPTTTSTGPPAR